MFAGLGERFFRNLFFFPLISEAALGLLYNKDEATLEQGSPAGQATAVYLLLGSRGTRQALFRDKDPPCQEKDVMESSTSGGLDIKGTSEGRIIWRLVPGL